ncbi:Signal recognition particle 19 kDa protein [Metallosphaera sp. J1]|uniref:signal recognition particle subunit SRP19/SEC65 family protein n=1 Tax=Metallosphaera javensis (ex Hofmann et al. 2022) TaxID=99938 RepID=UPI001EDEE2D7|nr:signal recognition particle subunit SRP19/SEC65 family protein [Metallosphaera javensis (ex Hofmann et al. 2022)]MCG3109892.1 Signal recognition particle 19 kDa protein [Metallosphaera javensis (ex Hofmann et al. 2022)]
MSLRDFEKERVVIWLAYFVAPSRRKGRRFPRLKVTLKELLDSCKALNLDPVVMEKEHPGSKVKGLVAVKKVGSKEKIENMVYERLKQITQSSSHKAP